jgi:hypothetical protein
MATDVGIVTGPGCWSIRYESGMVGDPGLGEVGRGQIAAGAVGPGGVVLNPPALDQHPGLEKARPSAYRTQLSSSWSTHLSRSRAALLLERADRLCREFVADKGTAAGPTTTAR